MGTELDEATLRDLVPEVIAVQEALLKALEVWVADPPRIRRRGWSRPRGGSSSTPPGRRRARQVRELRVGAEPAPGQLLGHDDTLELYLRCAHPSLTPRRRWR